MMEFVAEPLETGVLDCALLGLAVTAIKAIASVHTGIVFIIKYVLLYKLP